MHIQDDLFIHHVQVHHTRSITTELLIAALTEGIIERRGRVRIPQADVQEIQGRSGERLVRSSGNIRSERIEIYRPTRNEIQRSSGRLESRRADRPLSIDMNKIERPRQIIPRSPLENPSRSDQNRTVRPSDRSGRQGSRSRIQDQQQKLERPQMRRELIQRYGRERPPTPPAVREAPRQRIERQRESSPPSRPSTRNPQRSSGTDNERNRDEGHRGSRSR